MTATFVSAPPSRHTEVFATSGNDIERSIQLVLWRAQQRWFARERRREQRHPYPYPIRLAPVSADGYVPPEEIVVLGKHLSQHGLDFYHREPLPDRRVIVTFNSHGEVPLRLLMELTWCRFRQSGWYENGGRFVQALPFELIDLHGLPAVSLEQSA